MAITTYPADAVSGAPVYSGRGLRQTNVSASAAMGSTARPLGARSGIRAGTPDSVFSISGTTWSVGQHTGDIDTVTASEAGAYAYANDAPVTGTITAASGSMIRWDGVFAQLSDPAESAGTGTPRVDFVYVAGTAASTMPAAPARSFPLMRIVVPVSGTGSATVVPIAPFTASAGGVVPFRSLAEIFAWTANVPLGVVAQDLVTGGVYQRVGSAWRPVGTRRLGSGRRSADVVLAAGASWSDIASVVATSGGGLCVADAKSHFRNGNSGATRTLVYRLLCDNVQVGDTWFGDVPLTAGITGLFFAADWESTPGAGEHTWKLQAQASAASAVIVKNSVLTVEEN